MPPSLMLTAERSSFGTSRQACTIILIMFLNCCSPTWRASIFMSGWGLSVIFCSLMSFPSLKFSSLVGWEEGGASIHSSRIGPLRVFEGGAIIHLSRRCLGRLGLVGQGSVLGTWGWLSTLRFLSYIRFESIFFGFHGCQYTRFFPFFKLFPILKIKRIG